MPRSTHPPGARPKGSDSSKSKSSKTSRVSSTSTSASTSTAASGSRTSAAGAAAPESESESESEPAVILSPTKKSKKKLRHLVSYTENKAKFAADLRDSKTGRFSSAAKAKVCSSISFVCCEDLLSPKEKKSEGNDWVKVRDVVISPFPVSILFLSLYWSSILS